MGFFSKRREKKEGKKEMKMSMKDKKMMMDTGPINCPNCGGSMTEKMVNGMAMKLCSNCGGFFMNRDAFQNVIGIKVGEEVHEHTGEDVNCPMCKKVMMSTTVEDTEIELCPDCGQVHAEREDIVNIAKNKGAEKPKEVPETVDTPVEEGDILGFVLRMDTARNVDRATNGKALKDMLVDGMFVLYNNGLLITSYTSGLQEDMDEDIVGGMIMAITNFVQTSFSDFSDGATLQSIRFKDKEIAFEQGKYIIVALKMSGILEGDVRKDITSALKEIEVKYEATLKDWNGDVSTLDDLIEDFQKRIVPVKT